MESILELAQPEQNRAKTNSEQKNNELATLLIKLLQGFVLSTDKKTWEALLIHQTFVRDYFAKMHHSVHLNQEEGFAFLRKGLPTLEEESDHTTESNDSVPSLMRRMPLSFEVSLLCVLLREALEQFDFSVSDDHRLILNRSDIHNLLKIFYNTSTDEIKQAKKFDALINKIIELEFIKPLSNNADAFEVRRVIKALIDAEKLKEIKESMRQQLNLNNTD